MKRIFCLFFCNFQSPASIWSAAVPHQFSKYDLKYDLCVTLSLFISLTLSVYVARLAAIFISTLSTTCIISTLLICILKYPSSPDVRGFITPVLRMLRLNKFRSSQVSLIFYSLLKSFFFISSSETCPRSSFFSFSLAAMICQNFGATIRIF